MRISKWIALLSILAVSLACQVLTMIYGWGIHPRSWAWIVGVGYFLNIISHIVSQKVLKEED